MRLTRLIAASSLLVLTASYADAQPPQPPAPPPLPPAARLARLYQGRRADEQTDRLTRRVRLGRDGRVSIANISGDIVVSAGGGDDVTIDAVKHGSRGDFDRVRVLIDERAGRVDISTDYDRSWRGNTRVDVDYAVTVPADASVDLRSISGTVRVTGVKGSTRAQSISGEVSINSAPRVEFVKTISGNVDLAGVSHDGDLSIESVSGGVRANGVKARTLDIHTVSGDLTLLAAAVERLSARSVSGAFEYSGALARNGRYEVNQHSGDIRFTVTDNTGFELSATTFSGEIRSGVPLTLGGKSGSDVIVGGRGRGRGGRRGPGESITGTSGDGSARLDLRTFSGNIVISKK